MIVLQGTFPSDDRIKFYFAESPQTEFAHDARSLVIELKNPTLGDGRFAPEVAAALRGYADMLNGGCGDAFGEQLVTPAGTRLNVAPGPARAESASRSS